MKKNFSIIILLIMLSVGVFAQSTTITAGGSANMQLPILTNAQISAIPNPNVGMMIFDKTFNVVRVFNGSSWGSLSSSALFFTTAQIANVKSFTLTQGSGNTYTATGIRDFVPTDNAIADIKTTLGSSAPNGFLLDNQEVIVFENALSQALQGLSQQEIIAYVAQSQWTNPTIYNQPIDVVVKSDDANYIYAVREAGSYERREGYIMGVKVYRFTNKIFTEKYAGFVTVFDHVIKNSTSVNLITGMGITNADSYYISSTSPWFPVNNGNLTFPTNGNKPQNNVGIIYFLPKTANLPVYRMRIFTHKASAGTIGQYFDGNGNLINRNSYLDSYYTNILSSNIPFVLYLAGGTNLRSINTVRVPPPTAGTEE